MLIDRLPSLPARRTISQSPAGAAMGARGRAPRGVGECLEPWTQSSKSARTGGPPRWSFGQRSLKDAAMRLKCEAGESGKLK